MWIKKIKCLLLFLVFCSLHCYAQEEQQFTTRISTTDLWSKIEWNLQSLETQQQFSQIRLIELEKKLEQSEKALESRELLLQNLENSLRKSERDTKKWKNCCLVLGSTTVTFTVATVVLVAVMVNNK